MRRRMLAASIVLLATPALASEWHVDPLTSTITFTAEQAGESFNGAFAKFDSKISFDEAKPEKGAIRITIDMTKLQVEGKDRMDALPTKDWFAVDEFPIAEFIATGITATGSDKTGINSYLAKGKLNIRGFTRVIDLPFTLKTTGNATVAQGSVTLNRRDFSVGQGRWASDEWIKYPVTVRFTLHASKE